MQVMGDREMVEADVDGDAMPFDGAWHELGQEWRWRGRGH